MKKLVFYLLITSLIFVFATCNTATGSGPGTGGEGEEGVYDWGIPGYKNDNVFGTDNEWPGYELLLAECPNKPDNIGDISQYSNVILTAVLYDRKGNKFPADTQPSDLEAQFHILLDGSSGWTDENKLATQTNLVLEGDTTASVTKTGIPGKVLVQARYQSTKADTEQVGYIEIQKVVFVPKVSDVVLDEVYDKGSYLDVVGNKITFNNAMYSDAAALFAFPASWGATEAQSLAGKTITFNYSIETHTCVPAGSPPDGTTIEHQLHIQAAHDDNSKDKYNGNDGTPGQEYIELTNGNGTFTVTADKLIAASQASNATPSAFILNAVRIVNNGTEWNESGVGTHYRCKTYSIVFNSITIAP